jgi:hypothetical protein
MRVPASDTTDYQVLMPDTSLAVFILLFNAIFAGDLWRSFSGLFFCLIGSVVTTTLAHFVVSIR